VLLTAWITLSAMVTARRPTDGLPAQFTAVVRHRIATLRSNRDSGLTTVEVAIITAVLLGLATALVAAITLVVSRNTAKIR
jgi:hypothetical protein